MRHPPGVLKLSVVALRKKKTKPLLSTSTRDWWYIFDPRSTFDLVMAGQRSIFGEIDVFNFTREKRRSYDMKPLPSCSVGNWHHFDI